MKLPKELKGKYVTRAAFAKMQAEKQSLEKDIRLMVKGGIDGAVIWRKWKKHFKIKDDITSMLREAAQCSRCPTCGHIKCLCHTPLK